MRVHKSPVPRTTQLKSRAYVDAGRSQDKGDSMDPISWDKIKPTAPSNLDTANAVEVPAEVLARFKSTKGLGRTVKRETGGAYVVRTIDGKAFLIPVVK